MTCVGDVVGDTYGILQIKPGVVSLGIMVSYCLRFASQILLGKVDCIIPLKKKKERPAKVPANQVTSSSYDCGGNFKCNRNMAIKM